MRPSSSSLVMARARISRSVKSLKRLSICPFSEEMYRRESHKRLPEAIMMRAWKNYWQRFPQARCCVGTFVLSSRRTRPTFCRVRPLYRFSLSGCLFSVLQEMQFLGKGDCNGVLARFYGETDKSEILAFNPYGAPGQSSLQD